MSIVDDTNDTPVDVVTSSGGFGRTLRSFAVWLFVLAVAVGAGFAGGYVLHYQELRDLEREAAEERAELAAQVASLERQALETEKAQLEAALARANVVANLDEVLTMLPEALAEIEQFGRAMRDLDAAESALTDAGVSGESRDALGVTLGALRTRLMGLDLKARARIAASAKDLEHALATSQGVEPQMTVPSGQAPAEAAADGPIEATPETPAPDAASDDPPGAEEANESETAEPLADPPPPVPPVG